MLRNLKIRTAAEEVMLQAHDDLTLEEFLRGKRIPPGLFQGYIINGKDTKPVPLNIKIKTIPFKSEIVVQCIRNTDFRDILPQSTIYNKVKNPVVVISDLDLGGKECAETIHEVDAESAREVVRNEVYDFMKENSKSGKLVVGISGGGDSNTLAQSLKDFSKNNPPGKNLIFFTIILDPIWPFSAAERAAELCRENNLQHEIYDSTQIEKLLGMKAGIDKCYKEYCKKFGDNTSHFFGTYLISLVARKLCKKHEASEYVLGFNREDLLADLLYSLINGQKPLAFPVRSFNNIKLLMPVWKVPKVVLDACYPKYSLSNYKEREMDKSTYQRNIIYYLAHGVDDVYLNLGLSLMQGVQKIFANDWPRFQHEEDLDLFVSDYADKSKIVEVRTFLEKYFDFSNGRREKLKQGI